jgi:hypothetical protein
MEDVVIELEIVLAVLAVVTIALLSVVVRHAVERWREPRVIHVRRRHLTVGISDGEPRVSRSSGTMNHRGGDRA